MIAEKVSLLFNNKQQEPRFVFNHDFGRGVCKTGQNNATIVKSRRGGVWRIVGDNGDVLEEVIKESNVVYDQENYVVEWNFRYVQKEQSEESCGKFFFHWKGNKAKKTSSPLPTHVDKDSTILERITQWGEPMVFFHVFPMDQKLVILQGKHDTIDVSKPHLFMVRGEIPEEIHLVELPFKKSNLRSRAIFFIVKPDTQTIFKWTGLAVPKEHQETVQKLQLENSLKNLENSWINFDSVQINEGTDDALGLTDGIYVKIENVCKFTPRLFYLFFIENEMFPTEVEYPLRSSKHVCSYPFLQSHLYTATQPALFLLDNNETVWLWSGDKNCPEFDKEIFKKQFDQAKELVNLYAKEKETKLGYHVSIRYANAGEEPSKFTNVFPYWEM